MPAVFEDVKLQWRGDTYIIPSNRVMGAIARVEQHVTLNELYTSVDERGTIKIGTMAMAYGSLLRYAGAVTASDDDVYAGMFKDSADGNLMIEAIRGLIGLMMPPALRRELTLDFKSEEKEKPGN